MKSIWEEGRTNDRWLVVTDDQDTAFICALADISAELEWRMLVVGNNISCCRKTCMLLDDLKLKNLHYEILTAMESTSRVEARRNAGYLYAIQHGARHIFDSYPETYTSAKIPLETFRREMFRQLQNVALNVALGVVSERPYVKRVQNPYAHFGRPDLWTEGFRRNNQRFIHNHIYRICEVRPPSIEKFLDIDEDYFDWAAPALTLPGSTVAPFSSKNTLYSIEAFWGLVLFPTGNSSQVPTIPPHLLRTLWNQAVLGDIAGSLKLSLANVSTLQRREKSRKNPADLREPDGLASFILKWTCSTRSSLSCTRDLFQTMFQLHYISFKSLGILQSWINDLKRSHYLEPPVIPRRRGQMNPCLGADGLYGVAFYPALPVKSISMEQLERRNATIERFKKEETRLDALNRALSETLDVSQSRPNVRDLVIQGPSIVYSESGEHNIAKEEPVIVLSAEAEGTHESPITSRHAKLYDSHGAIEMPILREFTDNACPGYSQLLPHIPDNPFKNVLLIVAMTAMRYEMIPMFEVVYREHFRNILYCGSPHDSIEIFLRKYQLSEDRSFSFLPIHSKYTYECLLGALEMGYNVDGWIMSTDDALINSWNIHQMNYSKLWYSGDSNVQVTAANWKTLDPGSQKLPRSLDGVQKVLEFLKSSLIGSVLPDDASSGVGSRGYHEHHHYSPSRITKREAEIETGKFKDKLLLEKTVSESRNHTMEPHDDEGPHDATPKMSELSSDQMLHLSGRTTFDAIELKKAMNGSVGSAPQPRKLSSLNYVFDTGDNKTEIDVELIEDEATTTKVKSEHQEIEDVLAKPVNTTSSKSVEIDNPTIPAEDEDITSMEIERSFINVHNTDLRKSDGIDDDRLPPVAGDVEIELPLLSTLQNTTSVEADLIEAVELMVSEEDVFAEGDDLSESETERPVSEVLRKLLVATRNTTNVEQPDLTEVIETVSNVSTEHNSSSTSSAEKLSNYTNSPPELTVIIEEILVEDDQNKPVSDKQESPIVDLLEHQINSSTELSDPRETPLHNSSVSDPELVSSVEMEVTKPESNQTEIVGLEVAIASSISHNETSTPVIVEEHKHSEESTTTSKTTSSHPRSHPPTISGEEERKNAETLHVGDTLSTLKELYTLIKENLGVRSDDADDVRYADAAFYGGDRGYRLNPKSIHHFRCEKGTNLEFCKVSSEFLYQLSENIGKEFQLVYDKVPLYYIPKKDQLKFYLLSNLMLQHGVTDEIAIPLILSGLGPENEWVKLEKSYFGGVKGRTSDASTSKYPLFNTAAAVLYPTDLNTVTTDPKLQKIFCLKYLLRVLQL